MKQSDPLIPQRRTSRWRNGLFGLAAALFMAPAANAQVSYSNNFEANSTGWTGNFSRFTGATACAGNAAMRRNVYSGTVGNLVSPNTGTANGGLVTLTYDYKINLWSANTAPTPTPWGSFTVQYGATASGPWTTIATVTNETQTGSCIGKSHTFTPPVGAVFLRWTTAWTGGDSYWNFDNVVVQEALPPCTGTPAPGTTTGPASVCATIPFTLGLTNTTPGSGVSYQWYADDGSGFVPVGTDSPTLTTSQSVATSYYVDVTCSAGPSTGTSSVLSVAMNAPTACYCTPTGAANNSDEIRNFTLSTLNNNSAASEGTAGYSNYTGTVAAAQLTEGLSYTASLTSGAGTGNHGAAIWIDYNDNGFFEATERVADLPSTIGANATVSFPSFTAGAVGVHRLRVQYTYSQAGAGLNPCTITSAYAETEDYLVNIVAGTACTTPAPGATTGPANACSGVNFTLGIANEATETGIS
ncbi:MAG: GEVED domain-containing protein, partial [Flavobacteriales bacterium]